MEKSLASKEHEALIQLLRATRKSMGVTQVQLAGRLNVVQSFISDCERGQLRLDLVEVLQWCDALGVSFSTFAATFEAKARQTTPPK